MNKKKILLLTLVHPDFLPPVYAIAQVLRDENYNIHILTFDSLVPAQIDLGANIELETLGKHYNSNTLDRLRLRNKFRKRAKQLAKENPFAIIAFCPFSFNCGLKIKNNNPLIYFALEIADFILPVFFHSPLSNYRNLKALQNIKKADIVVTPSIRRSAWMAGRCHLNTMPYTVLNTAYMTGNDDGNKLDIFNEIVPSEFLNKKIILYTGAVNTEHCILELAEAFDIVNNEQSALIITGIKDNEYCDLVKAFVEKCNSRKRILLFPYLTRVQMLSLQSNAHIGVCFEKEYQNNVRSKMAAPNKVGEYISKNLYIIGLQNEYLRVFEMIGIASLAKATDPKAISNAIIDALIAVNESDYKIRVQNFFKNYYCMQQQLTPIIKYLNENN